MRSSDRYAPSTRLELCRSLLHETGGLTVYQLAERLAVSVDTARRYIRALDETDPLYETVEGTGRKVWRLTPNKRKATIQLTPGQMIALSLTKRVFDPFKGTGFKEDLDDVFAQLEATLKHRKYGQVANVSRKMLDLNEGRYQFDGRAEDINAIITALIKEERLRVHYKSRARKAFVIEPLTLLVYKKGLHLAAYSEQHEAIRHFALDQLRDVEWLRGDGFDYPADWDPEAHYRDAFGLFKEGPVEIVRIRFTDKAIVRQFRRRQRHPSQRVRRVAGGIEVTMRVHVSREFMAWVMGYGALVEVLEPLSLREALADELRRALERYS